MECPGGFPRYERLGRGVFLKCFVQCFECVFSVFLFFLDGVSIPITKLAKKTTVCKKEDRFVVRKYFSCRHQEIKL